MLQVARGASVFPIRTVLVVDPDADTLELCSLMLADVAHTIEHAEDGRIALAKALAQPPDLLVTDTQVPFIDGYALCRLLRSDPATVALPIVVATSDGTVASVHRARAAGANAVLAKPFAVDPFIATIRDVLEAQCVRPQANQVVWKPEDGAPPAHHDVSRRKARAHQRYATITPPLAPPGLVCPDCDRQLLYVHSHIGGVNANHTEQWDRFDCPAGCGSYQYRHRTKNVRRLA